MNEKYARSAPLYRSWPLRIREVERISLSRIDASSWLRTVVAMLATEQSTGIRVASEGHDWFLREPSISEMPVIRLVHYLSSERLFSLLLSAEKGMPYIQFAKTVRAEDLNKFYAEVAEGRIPTGLAGQADFSLHDCLKNKLTTNSNTQLCSTVVEFVKKEAELLSDRTFINALKHGRAVTGAGCPEGVGLSVMLDGVNYEELIPNACVIAVEDWIESADGYSHVYHFETFDLRGEVLAFYITQLLTEAIIRSRLALLQWQRGMESSTNSTFFLPVNIIPTASVARYKNLPASFRDHAP